MKERVIELIADQMYLNPSEVSEDSRFIDDLKAESLEIAQMLITMENEFGITFEEEELSSIKTVRDVIKYIENKQK